MRDMVLRLQDQIEAQQSQLDAQESVLEENGLADEGSKSALSSFLEGTDFSGWVATMLFAGLVGQRCAREPARERHICLHQSSCPSGAWG